MTCQCWVFVSSSHICCDTSSRSHRVQAVVSPLFITAFWRYRKLLKQQEHVCCACYFYGNITGRWTNPHYVGLGHATLFVKNVVWRPKSQLNWSYTLPSGPLLLASHQMIGILMILQQQSYNPPAVHEWMSEMEGMCLNYRSNNILFCK